MMWSKEKLYAIDKGRATPPKKSKKTVKRNEKIQLIWDWVPAKKMSINDALNYLALFEEYQCKLLTMPLSKHFFFNFLTWF